MWARLSVNQDAVAGFLFVSFGAAGLWFGRGYEVGTLVQMGPGYFPMVLSWLLIVLGLGIGIKGAMTAGHRLTGWKFRPVGLVLASLVVFGALVERVGLPIAATGCTLIGALGSSEFKWREQLLLSVSLAIAASLLFVRLLGLPIPIWPF